MSHALVYQALTASVAAGGPPEERSMRDLLHMEADPLILACAENPTPEAKAACIPVRKALQRWLNRQTLGGAKLFKAAKPGPSSKWGLTDEARGRLGERVALLRRACCG
jgi:hypothetical protein